jgi:hypothetical protein
MKHISAVRSYLFQAQVHNHFDVHGTYPAWNQMRAFYFMAACKAQNYAWPKMPSRNVWVSLA